MFIEQHMQNIWEVKSTQKKNWMEWLYQNGWSKNLLKVKLKTYWILNRYNKQPETIEIDDKQLNKELAEKMNNAYYFTDRAIQVGFNITLENHHINHANFKLKSKSNYTEFGTELRYINKKWKKELSVIYARLINQ